MKKYVILTLVIILIAALASCTVSQTVTTEAETTIPQTTEEQTTVETTEEQTTEEETTEQIRIEGIPDDLTFLFPDGADGYIIENFGMICIGKDDGTAEDGRKFAELLLQHGFTEKTRKEEKDDMGYDGFFGQYESEKYEVDIIVNSVQMHRLSISIMPAMVD